MAGGVKLRRPKRGPVPADALAYWRRKKIEPDFDTDEAWAEEHDLAFRIAGIVAEDYLAAIFEAIDAALGSGLTWETFRKNLGDTLADLGFGPKDGLPAHRLKFVYQTNLRVARAAGQWARVQRTKSALPFLVYELGPSVKHRPLHVTWAGTVRRVDDPWWATHMPPNGHGCKCRVRQISRREAERRGGESSIPDGQPEEGWARNPGAERLPDEG
jgi:hypothetical protein